MVRPICRDTMLLAQPSTPAGKDDLPYADDLTDTLKAHLNECVGMACNMIGIPVRIIAVCIGAAVVPMINPVILKKAGAYTAEEGCLSLAGVRKTERFRSIRVRWQDTALRTHEADFSGFTAQIIQHECDHLQGVLI